MRMISLAAIPLATCLAVTSALAQAPSADVPTSAAATAYRQGDEAERRSAFAEAATLYGAACEGGYAAGCTMLGRMYGLGRGVARDQARAAALYKRGCDGGDQNGCTSQRNLDPQQQGQQAAAQPQGSGAGATPAAGSGSNSGGAAYPTKPMVAMGEACAGFTLENYRTRAFQAGAGDPQLNAMCGQAFVYYSAYLNAIRQGYAEADADRTFAAHQAAARNAIAFHQNYR
jgi:TPR repeat protein